MNKLFLRGSLITSIAFSALTYASSGTSPDEDFRLLGLAMHQETGRNIYLGAVHLTSSAPTPDNVIQSRAPKMMEYRIVARRTSIRSLVGKMFLQSEVANGIPPSAETMEFADNLLSAVHGSLYAGDSLKIKQNSLGQLIVLLNDTKLTSSEDSSIFTYLLKGWVSENGPSTAFRSNILQQNIETAMLSTYKAITAPEERLAAVSGWSANEQDSTELQNETPTESGSEEIVVGAEVSASSSPEPTGKHDNLDTYSTEQLADVEGSIVNTSVARSLDSSFEAAEVWTFEDKSRIAAVPLPDSVQNDPFDILSLDVTEYSYRLAEFTNALIRLVYSKIHYPRQAVRRSIQGALELDVTELEDGSLVEVAIVESSGYSILDNAALEAAQQALTDMSLGVVDPVAVAEYGISGSLVVPVPVNFVLRD